MKLSVAYKSTRRPDTYLYVANRDNFERVPSALLKMFGVPKFVMLVALTKHDIIAGIDTQAFINKIEKDGFYLQLPPKQKNWLEEHLEMHKLANI